jgi:peroxiredoxin
LELQAQGVRMLARPEIADYLRLTTDQRGKLDKLFAATDDLAAKAATREGQSDSKATSAARAAKKAETEKGFQLLTSEQQRRLHLAVGSLLDTAKLERIYPLAPELIDSGSWSGSPAQLASLRGRVVLVHFYAFQCSNCQANFGIYNRWQKSLAPKGVELIGIQTPETAAERDVSKVLAAAKKDEFQFPVLIDLESANWNAWSNTMWPTVYVVDKQGYIRFWWQGELNWQGATADKTIEDLVARLLKE